jgi:hypothetical protein
MFLCFAIDLFCCKQVTRSERILAKQDLPDLRLTLRNLAAAKRHEKGGVEEWPEELSDDDEEVELGVKGEKLMSWTPHTRMKMYKEQAVSPTPHAYMRVTNAQIQARMHTLACAGGRGQAEGRVGGGQSIQAGAGLLEGGAG